MFVRAEQWSMVMPESCKAAYLGLKRNETFSIYFIEFLHTFFQKNVVLSRYVWMHTYTCVCVFEIMPHPCVSIPLYLQVGRAFNRHVTTGTITVPQQLSCRRCNRKLSRRRSTAAMSNWSEMPQVSWEQLYSMDPLRVPYMSR